MIQKPMISQRIHGISPLSLEVGCNQNIGTFENLGTIFVTILFCGYHIFKNLCTSVLIENKFSLFLTKTIKLYKYRFETRSYLCSKMKGNTTKVISTEYYPKLPIHGY